MELLRFEMLTSASPVNGHLGHVIEDHAFNFIYMDEGEAEKRQGWEGTTSFVVDMLQLEVSVDTSLYLDTLGYCPMGRWKRSSFSPPVARRGSLRADHDKPLLTGVSIMLDQMMPAKFWFDPDTGWFRAGNKESATGVQAVEFAKGCIAVVAEGRLSSLWFQPENWKEVAGGFSARIPLE